MKFICFYTWLFFCTNLWKTSTKRFQASWTSGSMSAVYRSTSDMFQGIMLTLSAARGAVNCADASASSRPMDESMSWLKSWSLTSRFCLNKVGSRPNVEVIVFNSVTSMTLLEKMVVGIRRFLNRTESTVDNSCVTVETSCVVNIRTDGCTELGVTSFWPNLSNLFKLATSGFCVVVVTWADCIRAWRSRAFNKALCWQVTAADSKETC